MNDAVQEFAALQNVQNALREDGVPGIVSLEISRRILDEELGETSKAYNVTLNINSSDDESGDDDDSLFERV